MDTGASSQPHTAGRVPVRMTTNREDTDISLVLFLSLLCASKLKYKVPV